MAAGAVLALGALGLLLLGSKRKKSGGARDNAAPSEATELARESPGESVEEVTVLTPDQVQAETDRIVDESEDIIRGRRDEFSFPADELAPATAPGSTTVEDDAADDELPPPPATQGPEESEPVDPSPAVELAQEQPSQVVDEVAIVEAPQSGPSASEAAQGLAAYAADVLARGEGALLGVKRAPSEVVRAAQAAMGGLVADGIYGPATRRRGQELGVSMPVRR